MIRCLDFGQRTDLVRGSRAHDIDKGMGQSVLKLLGRTSRDKLLLSFLFLGLSERDLFCQFLFASAEALAEDALQDPEVFFPRLLVLKLFQGLGHLLLNLLSLIDARLVQFV